MSNSSDSLLIKIDSNQEISPRKKRLSFIQSDLTSALESWIELEKANVSLSPDEEQLLKIKSLIGQLREKLEHF